MEQVFSGYVAFLEAEKNASVYTVRNYTNDLFEFFTEDSFKPIKHLNTNICINLSTFSFIFTSNSLDEFFKNEAIRNPIKIQSRGVARSNQQLDRLISVSS